MGFSMLANLSKGKWNSNSRRWRSPLVQETCCWIGHHGSCVALGRYIIFKSVVKSIAVSDRHCQHLWEEPHHVEEDNKRQRTYVKTPNGWVFHCAIPVENERCRDHRTQSQQPIDRKHEINERLCMPRTRDDGGYCVGIGIIQGQPLGDSAAARLA